MWLTKKNAWHTYILSVVAVLFLLPVVKSHQLLNTFTYFASIVSKHERQLCSTIRTSRSVPDKQTQPQIETYKQKQSVGEGWRRGRVVGKRRQSGFQRPKQAWLLERAGERRAWTCQKISHESYQGPQENQERRMERSP